MLTKNFDVKICLLLSLLVKKIALLLKMLWKEKKKDPYHTRDSHSALLCN